MWRGRGKKLTMKARVFLLFIFLSGCIGGGAAGSIIGFRYQTTKDRLEKAVKAVIKNNRNIYPDTINNYIIDLTNGKSDTLDDSYYNDGKRNITIDIKRSNMKYTYTFGFYGEEQYWKTSPSSAIFIIYAIDEFGRGGGEKDKDMDDRILRKKLINIFKTEFVNRIDKELNLKDSIVSAYGYID